MIKAEFSSEMPASSHKSTNFEDKKGHNNNIHCSENRCLNYNEGILTDKEFLILNILLPLFRP
jgi:hypothetical protein